MRAGLATATFEQRRQLAELLIDRVVVTDGEVQIRYGDRAEARDQCRGSRQKPQDELGRPGELEQPAARH